MSVMRFTAATSREAMRQVRAALGDEALILANRHTEQGVEILAMAESPAEALTAGEPPSPPAARAVSASQPAPTPVAPAAATAPSSSDAFQAMSAQLLKEMQDMRTLLARQRTADDGVTGRLAAWLGEAGFGQALADDLLAGVPEELAHADDAGLEAWLSRQLVTRLPVQDDDALLAEGGILALVGPTGVGKTTTTAKLAARYVMRHGPDQVALVSTDSFRIGAHEQLRIYADLLGIPMTGLDDQGSLDEALARFADKRLVIIDTVGMSQRDQRVLEQVARLQGNARAVRLVLLLNAASQPETLEEVINNFRQAARAAGGRLDDCVISKYDEAGRTGILLDALMRHGLRLLFVAHGQRVPEDLATPEAHALVSQALATRSAMPAHHVPSAPAARGLLGQGRRLAAVLGGLRERISDFAALEQAWSLTALPESLHLARLDSLLEGVAPASHAGVVWTSRSRVRGQGWSMPDLRLDDQGGWSALPLPQHRQPAGQCERLAWATADHGGSWHLLPALPEADAATWLAERQLAWVAQARPTQRVSHAGERLALSQLAALAEPLAAPQRRLRGREVRVRLSRLPVVATLGGQTLALRAWFAVLEERDSGRGLGRRIWLAPEALGDDALPLLLGQLDAETLPRLTRRAHARLGDSHPESAPALRLLLAGGLAAVAGQLERSQTEWARDLRADLLGLLGGRRRRSAEALLDALLYLGMAREAIRELAVVGREGLGA
ncbi:flagellar biosynthesis protein FlhF [Halomonas urumqiensis]|uniref:Flagellar biosynthesis protein FlhF n=1 Tax=Halomonas urumqiensis TaxID=1684789 RepID=A0A2N7UK93_9GAMM|nr:flagellar biosynthesis protein FlhF [Halomonas urumqiensis]PMR80864.1 flagellar biosynthesis protein FlhF [Halomonas urumqiensis]PTB02821.1 flagellar biosynthesis protein FlhF [Halomonas urumqiensis]GHE21329.1 hypothetical protein GCM10017767_18500 [Halomonas urumqiensis]